MSPGPNQARKIVATLITGLALGTAAIFSVSSFGQDRTDSVGKVAPSVLSKARIGTPQLVVVTLNADEKLAMAADRARDRMAALLNSGQSLSDEVRWQTSRQLEIEEVAAVIRHMVAELFPGGRHGRVKLVESLTQLPTVFAEMGDVDALLELAALPEVKSIQPIRRAVPAGTSHLEPLVKP